LSEWEERAKKKRRGLIDEGEKRKKLKQIEEGKKGHWIASDSFFFLV
jgi:hypothetical protein